MFYHSKATIYCKRKYRKSKKNRIQFTILEFKFSIFAIVIFTAKMNLEKRIESFSVLGKTLSDSLDGNNGQYGLSLRKLIERQEGINKWFTPSNVRLALEAIASILTEENLSLWTSRYPMLKEDVSPVRVGLIFAGNIPAVGFHDYLTVLISGNKLIAKPSSKDPDLIPFLHQILCDINPDFNESAKFITGVLNNFDVVIATGSNNSSRYFDYYFGKYPNIIRKNRNSVAIIEGSENDNELKALGRDIFSYFGLGCRNVSKVYLPDGYEITSLFEYWNEYSDCINHHGYANNYDYNKAIYLINKQDFLDTGYLLLKEDNKTASPVSVVNYEYYHSLHDVRKVISSDNNVQCVVGKNHVPFGQSQLPDLWDYADGVDTLDFLLKKNLAGIL
ncbi:MAG TPA: acyl-CoA reductase [Bacteroidales bacterium]|nr:acyl-CoA reductase [Bacteroidales bacterium]